MRQKNYFPTSLLRVVHQICCVLCSNLSQLPTPVHSWWHGSDGWTTVSSAALLMKCTHQKTWENVHQTHRMNIQ